MKINKILSRFLQVLVLSGSAIFTTKAASADVKNNHAPKTINDRINAVREHIRTQPGHPNDGPGNDVNARETTPLGQIWINIVPAWHDWNKLWNDWANWNNWSKWNDWSNFHREKGHDRDHDGDRGRGHDKDHGRGHDK